ncbi:hypothetical protein Tco_1525691 [Tanacetum coccineum]
MRWSVVFVVVGGLVEFVVSRGGGGGVGVAGFDRGSLGLVVVHEMCTDARWQLVLRGRVAEELGPVNRQLVCLGVREDTAVRATGMGVWEQSCWLALVDVCVGGGHMGPGGYCCLNINVGQMAWGRKFRVKA